MQTIAVIGFRHDMNRWIKINLQSIPVTFENGLPKMAENSRKRYIFIEPSRYNVDKLKGYEFSSVVDLTQLELADQRPDPYFMEVLPSRVRL